MHNTHLGQIADRERRRSLYLSKGIGVLGGGLVGGLTGNIIGRHGFNKKNPKEQFVEQYLYENPLASKIEAEAAYSKLKKRALIKSSLIGAGLGASVGYLGGSQITKGIFNNRLQKARELGERSISNRRNEIVNDFGYFGNNYESINVHDSTLSDGRLNKRVLVEKIIKDRDLGDKIQTNAVDDTEGGLKIKSKVTLNKTPKINKDYILSEPILQEGETLMEGIERLKDKFNDPNKNKSRRKY